MAQQLVYSLFNPLLGLIKGYLDLTKGMADNDENNYNGDYGYGKFTTREMMMMTTTQKREDYGTNYFYYFFTFDTCFLLNHFIDYEFPFEPKMICHQITNKIREYKQYTDFPH